MTTFTELNLQKLNSSQDGPRWARRLVRAPWPEPTSAVKNGRKPPFSARDPYVSASYRQPRGGSRSPAAFGSLGIFLSVCVLCFALFLFPMRSSDAERKPLRAVMWRKCRSYGLVPTGPPYAQRGQARDGRLPPLQDRRLGPEAALCSRECAQPAVGACVRLGFLRVERAATAPFIPTAAPCPEPVTEEAPPPA